MFFSFGSFGFSYGKTSITKWLFAIGLVLLGATLWGIFAAPKSEYRLGTNLRYLFEILMFLIGAFLFYKNNHPNIALAMAIISIFNVGFAFIYKQ